MSLFLRFAVLLLAFSTVFAAPTPTPTLPRALILGDSLYHPLSQSVTKDIKGRVQVVYKHPGNTTGALSRLDELIGKEKWDVIHFNFGLADLHYKAPGLKTVRTMSRHAGGVPVSTPQEYEKNLDEIVRRLKATGAKLIWANTTPVNGMDHLYIAGSEMQFNAIAAKIMDRHGITINDLHTFASALIKGQKNPPNSPFNFGKESLHPPVTASILKALNLPPAAPAPATSK